MIWWRNLSVSKKLYAVVGVMALLIATELGTLYFAMSTLSAVRAFVGGEGLWSKAQKTAVYHLQKYSRTHEEADYQRYQFQLSVPLGDHEARIQLEKPDMDLQAARDGFLAGQNHPQDILPMINLMRRFYRVPHLARAIEKWQIGDDLITGLIDQGERLHALITSGTADQARIDALMDEIFHLDDRLTRVETDFSAALGEASRWLEHLLMVLLILAVITVESTGLFLTVSFARGLTKVLGELNRAATQVGQGDFSQKVPIRSRDELGQLAESLNVMIENLKRQTSEKQNAEHASETKNLFLANMSHEIRTPLNAILGFSEILADPQLSPADRLHYAAIIKRTGASLTSIINDILDVSKVEAEQLEVELKSFSLRQLISDLEAVLRLRCEEKGIELKFIQVGEVSDFIQSDPTRLRQILANIVGNSIKFTARGGVSVHYEAAGGNLVFTVSDTGAGIPPEQVSRLFKPFSQGDDSVRKKYGGTGLGLLISQRLAQLLGGDVKLGSSDSSHGTTFVVHIHYVPVENPKASASAKKPVGKTEPTDLLKDKKILMVEDSVDNQLLAQLYLTRSGAQVEFADNGQIGVEKALEKDYDVILMDIQMPVMDGYTATRELRRRGNRAPIVALTGYAMKEDQARCFEAGCNDYLAKPFDRKSLLECVSRHVNPS